MLFNVLAMVAEFEADLIRLRAKEGMRVEKAKGRLRGKQPKLNPRQEAHLVALLKSGEYSTAEIGDLFGVARSSVYRAMDARKRAQTARRCPDALNWRYPGRCPGATGPTERHPDGRPGVPLGPSPYGKPQHRSPAGCASPWRVRHAPQ